jgi:hypothetical protein
MRLGAMIPVAGRQSICVLHPYPVPVVLFMENYDINRTGYHDSHDTMPT